MYIGIQSSADPLLTHVSMNSYSKSLMSYTQDYNQQLQEDFKDPNSKESVGHNLEPGIGYSGNIDRETILEPHWKRPYQILLRDVIAIVDGIKPCVHITHLKKAPADIWSCAEDL